MIQSPSLMTQAVSHSDRNDGRCTGITRAGMRCRGSALPGSSFCRVHAPEIEAADEGERGRYTGFAGGLEAKYQSALQDRYLLHLRDDIAILDARIQDLLAQTKEGVNAKAWTDAHKSWRTLRKAMRMNNATAIDAAIDRLDEVMDEGKHDVDLWADIQGLLETRRRLVESEQKYLAQTNQVIPVEAALVLLSAAVTAIKESVKKYVASHEVTEAIVLDAQAQYERLIGS